LTLRQNSYWLRMELRDKHWFWWCLFL